MYTLIGKQFLVVPLPYEKGAWILGNLPATSEVGAVMTCFHFFKAKFSSFLSPVNTGGHKDMSLADTLLSPIPYSLIMPSLL